MAKSKKINVLIKTNMGDIKIELNPEKAPITVENFMKYVESEFYNGLIFHRVIPNFMVQAGGFDGDLVRKEPDETIKIESDNGLKNDRGTIAMARTQEPNSATSQFFINLVNNDFLNFKSADVMGYGYTVFGKVTEGMEVVDEIAKIPTTIAYSEDEIYGAIPMKDVPTTNIEIISVTKL